MSSQASGEEIPKVVVETETACGSNNPPVAQPDSVAGAETNQSPKGISPVDTASRAFTDEILALKERVLALERTTAVRGGKVELTIPESNSHHQLSTEEQRRMERSLYEHRKKWDTYAGRTGQRRYTTAKGAEGAEEEKDGEKEMAEAELKRSEDLPPETEVLTATTVPEIIPDSEINKEEEVEANIETITPVFAKFEWFSFKRLGRISNDEATQVKERPIGGVCIIDVLVGHPVIRNADTNQRYGYSGRSGSLRNLLPRANVDSSDTPGQNLLPERIRVRSYELVAILVQILGRDNLQGLQSKPKSSPVVFVRPFKTLLYCEQALRDWCAALEKKFSTISLAGGGASVPELKPGEQSKDIDASSGSEGAPGLTGKEEQSVIQHPENREATVDDYNSEPDPKKERTPQNDDHVKRIGEDENPKEEKHPEEEQRLEDVEDDEDEKDDPKDITKSRTALSHLQCLLSFTDSEILARKAYLNSPERRMVHYSDLWLLFQPGVEVINRDGKQVYRVVEVNSEPHRAVTTLEGYWIDRAAIERSRSPFSITCVFIDFDGKHLGPVKKVFHLKPFEGEQDVTSLQTYPLRFFQTRQSDFTEAEWQEIGHKSTPQQQQFRKKLIARGVKFLDLIRVKHMYYAGPTLGARDEIDSQVVVDFETAFASEADAHQQWKPELSVLLGTTTAEDKELKQRSEEKCRSACCRDEFVYNDTHLEKQIRTGYIQSLLPKERGEEPSVAIVPRPLKEINTEAVTEDELLIMSFRVFGFVLRSQKWAQLDLSFMNDIHPYDDVKLDPKNMKSGTQRERPITSFDRLVLEKGHRPMIESLVAQHFRDKQSSRSPHEQVDIVKGKGKGLILLLHGAPGVGKTSTAEGVAELFKKPLFQMTCGDLGTTAREVEQALETNFALASRWDCILLLDEADVFLAARTKEDFIRNGLVSAFLRVMEYYTGILFLTTNRVGDFDEAFTSRIHVSLYYPELNEEKTVGVFKNNMDMIEERFALKDRRIIIDKIGIGSFASKHFSDHRHARWNGRQIRNACQTALALAEFEAQGNSHESILKPDAVIQLGVGHFETVQKAYLEFAKYMHDLYGTYASRRAKEEKLRAIWIDENDRVVATHGMGGSTMDKMRSAFVLGSQPQAYPGYPPPTTHRQQPEAAPFGRATPNLQQQPPGYQQPPYRQYQGIPTTLPPMGYNPSPAPGIDTRLPVQDNQFHNYTHPQARWSTPPTEGTAVGSMNTNNTEPGPSISTQPDQQQHQPTQPQGGQASVGGYVWGQPGPPQPLQGQQDQQQPPPALLSQGVQAMYAASRQLGSDYLG